MSSKVNSFFSGSGTKRSRNGAAFANSSCETTNIPPQKFDEQSLMYYRKDWYRFQQESKYLDDEYIDKRRFWQQLPNIHAQINALGLQYVFMNQGECNLNLVREFYANWNVYCVDINNGFIRDSLVRFSVEALNDFVILVIPSVGWLLLRGRIRLEIWDIS